MMKRIMEIEVGSIGIWVLIQTPEYGGGEIWFDGALIRQDGRVSSENLQALNEGLE